MNKQLTVFKFNTNEVRTILIDDQPWFIAKDVSDILEYRNSPDMCRRLDEDEKSIREISVSGQARGTTIINESGLYNAVLGSNKPQAKIFKKWVTSEVLPTIRKTGGYNVAPTFTLPTNYLEALKELTVQVEIKEKALLQIEEDKPKVDFHDLVTEAEGELLGRFAKVFGMGRNKFYALLRNDGYLQLDNMPYQRYIKQGIFEVRESKPYVDRGGVVHTAYQTLLTGKGQIYFTKRYFSKEYTAE